MKKILLSVFLSFICAIAFALPKPSEVKSAVESGNFVLAERMLKEVLMEKNTPLLHYQLGQVYSRQSRHSDAVNEYKVAQSMDPSLAFATSKDVFMHNMQISMNALAPPSKPIVQSHISPPVENSSNTGLIIVFLLLPTLAGLGYLTYMFFENRSKKKKEKEECAEVSKKLVSMISDLDDAELVTKTSSFNTDDIKTILDKISDVKKVVRLDIESSKSGNVISSYTLQRLQNNVDDVVNLSKNGIVKSKPVDDNWTKTMKTSSYNNTTRTSSKRNTYTPTPTAAPSPTYYPSAPAPVVVNNSSNDLLTGVLLGQAISNNNHYVPPPTAPSYRSRSEDDDFDYGSKSSRSSLPPAPSFDWGSSDSSSSSSFDSGSSSSSSSDSY